jgi:hypothetical protein
VKRPQIFQGYSGGCVAGDDYQLAAFIDQKSDDFLRKTEHFFPGSVTVGHMNLVSYIQQVFRWKQAADFTQD